MRLYRVVSGFEKECLSAGELPPEKTESVVNSQYSTTFAPRNRDKDTRKRVYFFPVALDAIKYFLFYYKWDSITKMLNRKSDSELFRFDTCQDVPSRDFGLGLYCQAEAEALGARAKRIVNHPYYLAAEVYANHEHLTGAVFKPLEKNVIDAGHDYICSHGVQPLYLSQLFDQFDAQGFNPCEMDTPARFFKIPFFLNQPQIGKVVHSSLQNMID